MATYYKKLLGLVTIGSVWYSSSKVDKKDMRKNMFDRGLNLSQKYKNYKAWDNFVEPFIITQFGLFFGAGHSFIKGMISDNDNKEKLSKKLEDAIDE